jgi:hypothetical protein
MMAGPSFGDFVIAIVPLALFGGLYILGLQQMRRQASALERIAAALEKRP